MTGALKILRRGLTLHEQVRTVTLRGSRVTMRPLRRTDLAAIALWKPFQDPLHAALNWIQHTPEKLEDWFRLYSTDPRRLIFAALNEKQVIGTVTLREIDGRRSARLGITLDADFVDQGYGSEILSLFFDFYFGELGFAKMVLDVAAPNRRAIRVYRKLGFQEVNTFERTAKQELAFLLDDPDLGRFYRRDWLGRWRLLHLEMELQREAWQGGLQAPLRPSA